jgi:DeoR/GlpR family transcriptional regulator of sugar metabolism
MKVFFSHSSKHKPLVREVLHYLPDHIRPWIDEKELLIGESISRSIRDAIAVDTDFVVLFVDLSSATSAWVKRELEWALEHERHLGRTFVVPVVLEPQGWELIEPASFRERKYLSCVDFSEEGIRSLANGLVSHLFAWVSRDLSPRSGKSPTAAEIDLLHDAEQYLLNLANEIRVAVQNHDRLNPFPMSKLYAQLVQNSRLKISSEDQFAESLLRLRQHGYLAGIVCHRDNIFVEEAYYGWKTGLFTKEKLHIAKRAVEYIDSSDVVALDAGSTTIQIARQICQGIKMRSWDRLTVVTNSLAAAAELLETVEGVGLEDNNTVIQVFITGGRIRCNTLAVVPLNAVSVSDFDVILEFLGGASICFVGANGVDWEYGFTTHDNPEIKTKKSLIQWSRKKFIVVDPSKFAMKQQHVFAGFKEGIEVITTRSGHESDMACFEDKLKERSTRVIYAD